MLHLLLLLPFELLLLLLLVFFTILFPPSLPCWKEGNKTNAELEAPPDEDVSGVCSGVRAQDLRPSLIIARLRNLHLFLMGGSTGGCLFSAVYCLWPLGAVFRVVHFLMQWLWLTRSRS